MTEAQNPKTIESVPVPSFEKSDIKISVPVIDHYLVADRATVDVFQLRDYLLAQVITGSCSLREARKNIEQALKYQRCLEALLPPTWTPT